MAMHVFKTAWFSKAAKKMRLTDAELCAAILQVMQGQAADLGGGVFKKRLAGNRHRSIILAKGGKIWVYEYLFAKQDRDNISADELAAFKTLAKTYAGLTGAQIDRLVADEDFMEICDGKAKRI